MKRLATVLMCAAVAFCLLAGGAEAGNNAGAAIIVHVVTTTPLPGSCAAMATQISGTGAAICGNAVPTAAAGATRIVIGVYANQLASNDPNPIDPLNPGLHLMGVDFGIHYDPLVLNVAGITWTKCSDLEIPTDGVNPPEGPFPAWPNDNSGNSLVWGGTGPITGELALLGFFRIDPTYLTGPVMFSIGHHPDPTVPARFADDQSSFDVVQFLPTAGLGGASGVNNCPVAVRPVTWGNIKSLFR